MFSFLYGICIGIVNDINRIVRVFFGVRYTKINFDKLYEFLKIVKKENSDNTISSKSTNSYLNILIFIQDIFLALFAATGIILLNYYFNDGRFRIFTVLAMMLSAILYYFTVGKLIMLISEPIMLVIRTSFLFILKIILLPIRKAYLCIYLVIKNAASKTKKYIANRINIRYYKREVQRLFDLSKHGFIDLFNNRNHKENEG